RRSQRPVAISDDRRESPTPPRAARSSSPASWHRSEPPPAEPPRAISPRRVFDGGPFARSSSAPPRVSSVPPHSSPVPPHSSSVPPHSSPLPPHSSPVPPHGSSPPPYSSGHGGLFSAGPPAGDSSLPPRISSTPSSLPPVDDLPRRRRDTDPSLAPPPFDELDEEADRVTVHPILEVQRDPDEPLPDDEDLWDEDTADRPTLLLPEEPTAFVAVAEVQGASSTLEAETPHVLMSRDAWMALATPSLADLPAPKTPLSQALEALLI
ncbi:MAG: hypothetical protein KC731_27920, partial [Myxococcales bacterium]|nr:hypothetical protein [Myxococcales bacterium]